MGEERVALLRRVERRGDGGGALVPDARYQEGDEQRMHRDRAEQGGAAQDAEAAEGGGEAVPAAALLRRLIVRLILAHLLLPPLARLAAAHLHRALWRRLRLREAILRAGRARGGPAAGGLVHLRAPQDQLHRRLVQQGRAHDDAVAEEAIEIRRRDGGEELAGLRARGDDAVDALGLGLGVQRGQPRIQGRRREERERPHVHREAEGERLEPGVEGERDGKEEEDGDDGTEHGGHDAIHGQHAHHRRVHWVQDDDQHHVPDRHQRCVLQAHRERERVAERLQVVIGAEGAHRGCGGERQPHQVGGLHSQRAEHLLPHAADPLDCSGALLRGPAAGRLTTPTTFMCSLFSRFTSVFLWVRLLIVSGLDHLTTISRVDTSCLQRKLQKKCGARAFLSQCLNCFVVI